MNFAIISTDHNLKDIYEIIFKIKKHLDDNDIILVSDIEVIADVEFSIADANKNDGWDHIDKYEIEVYSDGVFVINLPKPNIVMNDFDASKKTTLNMEREVIGLTPIKNDMVNHPQHYISEAGIEVIDVIKAFTADLTGIEATDTGNIIKYICRWKHKNGLQDLEKAKWYLEHLIKNVKEKESK